MKSAALPLLLAILALSLVCADLSAQASPGASPRPASGTDVQADAIYQKQDYARAEPLYQSLVDSNPENARYWFRLGTSARANRHYEVAMRAFAQAKKLGATRGLPPYVVDYEIARTYASQNDAQQALATLKTAVDAGFLQPERLEHDAEWAPLRSDPQFPPLLQQVRHNADPCGTTPEAHQFDFWLGDWDVVSASGGPPAGTSHIQRDMGSCVIWENWTSNGTPYFGKSYNTYNQAQKRWEQYWVDNFAGVMFFHGSFKSDERLMDFWTDDMPQPNGGTLRRHLQFFSLSPGKVRQFSQASTDGGQTWKVEYDFLYTRRPARTATAAK